MTITDIAIQVLGLTAGSIVCVSALPRVREIWRDPTVAARESVPRNVRLVAGNMLWVAYGAFADAPAIIVMCAISALLNGIILRATVQANR